jgi:hypothetical protein
VPHTDHERMPSGLLDGEKDLERVSSCRYGGTIGKCDPLAAIASEQGIAGSPISLFIRAPFGMELASDFRG